jgi:Protein of unknown function (DUF1501)
MRDFDFDDLWRDPARDTTRRRFLRGSMSSLAALTCASLTGQAAWSAELAAHFAAKAKRVVFLHQSGAPSQLDLFDPKPEAGRRHGQELPDSVRRGQRLTGMTADQPSKPIVGSEFGFSAHGKCGTRLSELLPQTAKIVDDICVVRSMQTDAINHDPAITLVHTGSQLPGNPSMGAWIHFGLGSDCDDLPAFTVMISGGQPGDQPLFSRLWGAGFLPSHHAGVRVRAAAEPVPYLSNPPGIDRGTRDRMIDTIQRMNRLRAEATGNREIEARNLRYRLAERMQDSVPRLTDLSGEPRHVLELYGPDVHTPGTYAANCLLARRMVERGVRFVQLYHRGWDHHEHLPKRIRAKCLETDQPSAALVRDLKQRGLLDETLVIWAGEFGRTVYCQGPLTPGDYGRDHHPRCFSIWLAGGGIRGGATYGRTDDFSYNTEADGVHVHDLQATVLHCLGLDHTRLTFRFQGREARLTDVGGRVVAGILE